MSQHGVAYVSSNNAVVLNLARLGATVRDLDRSAYLAATGEKAGDNRILSGFDTYAYSPDGTLWKLGSSDDWEIADPADLPRDFPTSAGMNMSYRGNPPAALAWLPAPEGPVFCVTCFLLNHAAFTPPAEQGTTYYNVTKLEQ